MGAGRDGRAVEAWALGETGAPAAEIDAVPAPGGRVRLSLDTARDRTLWYAGHVAPAPLALPWVGRQGMAEG